MNTSHIDTMMDREETSDSIPIDLVPEILSRVPAKSIARFRCVSKLWGSMLCRSYFTELFITRSSARPHLLFAIERKGELIFFSSSQRKNSYDESSLVISTGFHMRLPDPGDMRLHFCGYASGLICFHPIPKEDDDTTVHVICSPSTGQCASLPKLERDTKSYSFLGFDPIEKQFKVLNMVNLYGDHKILTLGTGELRWRDIQGPRGHDPMRFPGICVNGVCINGVLYYLSNITSDPKDIRMVSFDVRSEKFCKVISANCFDGWIAIKLINYKGKLGGVHTRYARISGKRTLVLCMCVLEDTEKQEWSEYVYTFPEDIDPFNCFIVGVTATGEIVLSRNKTSKPFYVFYLNPERNTLQCVEIQGNHEAFETNNNTVKVFVDHIENVKFNI